jgi:hypothetical protein
VQPDRVTSFTGPTSIDAVSSLSLARARARFGTISGSGDVVALLGR